MKAKRAVLLSMSAILTAVLVMVLLVPFIPTPGGRYTGCGPSGCTQIVQYESLSYELGGWGALFQTGVNWYSVEGWSCSCPAETVGHEISCCIPPLAGVVWPTLAALLSADLISVALAVRFSASSPLKPKGSTS